MISARDEVVARIRAANEATIRLVGIRRDYRMTGLHEPGSPVLIDVLHDRLVDYKATVRRTDDHGLPDSIAGALAEAPGAGGLVLVPAGLPHKWVPGGERDDGSRSAMELDNVAAVVTACVLDCAETGTIVLDSSADQGRRAITLVPDVHVCIVRDHQIVETVPEMMARCDPNRPLTFVSGPSATSDIELERVEGVHGPRPVSHRRCVGTTDRSLRTSTAGR